MNNVLNNIKQVLYKLRPLLFIVAIICFVKAGTIARNYIITQMPASHIFVCDNPNVEFRSEFDLWLKNELKIEHVPTYVIIQDGYVIGIFDGCIDEYDFSSKLSMAASYNIQFNKIPDYKIENLNNERVSASEVFGKPGLYVLEISWIECEDCKYQDEHFTDSIYKKYTTNNIYRYYVLSDRTKVKNYHQ